MEKNLKTQMLMFVAVLVSKHPRLRTSKVTYSVVKIMNGHTWPQTEQNIMQQIEIMNNMCIGKGIDFI